MSGSSHFRCTFLIFKIPNPILDEFWSHSHSLNSLLILQTHRRFSKFSLETSKLILPASKPNQRINLKFYWRQNNLFPIMFQSIHCRTWLPNKVFILFNLFNNLFSLFSLFSNLFLVFKYRSNRLLSKQTWTQPLIFRCCFIWGVNFIRFEFWYFSSSCLRYEILIILKLLS